MDTSSHTPVVEEEEPYDGKFLYKIPEVLDTELTLLSRFTATINVWASCILLFVSTILYMVAFSTVHWSITTTELSGGEIRHFGLWQVCIVVSYKVCQAFACLALLSLLSGVVSLLIYCGFQQLQDIRTLRVITLATRVSAALFLLVTFAVYTDTCYKPDECYTNDYHTSLSHSYSLTVASFIIESLASVLVLMAMRSKNLEVRLKQQQAMQEAREKTMSRSYSDEPLGTEDLSYDLDRSQTLSPFEAFKRFSGMEESVPAFSNSAYQEDGTNFRGQHRGQGNGLHNKHIVQAEVNIEAVPKNEPRSQFQSPSKYEDSRRSYENIPDGSSQPPTPRNERNRTVYIPPGYVNTANTLSDKNHSSIHRVTPDQEDSNRLSESVTRPPRRKSKHKHRNGDGGNHSSPSSRSVVQNDQQMKDAHGQAYHSSRPNVLVGQESVRNLEYSMGKEQHRKSNQGGKSKDSHPHSMANYESKNQPKQHFPTEHRDKKYRHNSHADGRPTTQHTLPERHDPQNVRPTPGRSPLQLRVPSRYEWDDSTSQRYGHMKGTNI